MTDLARFMQAVSLAHAATISYDDHRDRGTTIREHLVDDRSSPADEADVLECETAGHIWELHWCSSSVGFYTWIAGTYDNLIRKVLADPPTEVDRP